MAMNEADLTTPNVETVSEVTTPEMGIGENYREFIPLYKHFGMEDSKGSDKYLSEIWSYAKGQAISKDKDSIILEVIKLNNQLGSVGLGEQPYSKIYNYLTVMKQFKKVGKVLQDMKKS